MKTINERNHRPTTLKNH